MTFSLRGPLLAALVAVSPAIPAQAPAAPPPAGPGMVATDRYLFVLRGDVLYQFDVHTLQLRRRHDFAAAGAAAAGAPAPAPTAEPVAAPPPAAAGALRASIRLGLVWLARHQDEDGRWDADGFMKHDREGAPCDGAGKPVHDVGVTGLAVLAMLGGGNTMRSGPHREAVKNGIRWLREQQQENGLFGTNATHDFIYDHAIAAFAVSEAYGLSNYALLKPVAQQGINYLESHRNPFAVWRYQPRDNDNDTSVTTWAVAALVSAKHFGLEVNPQALQQANAWYEQVTGPDGRAGYTKAGEGSSRLPGDHAQRFPPEQTETLTAAALYGRLLLGQDPKAESLARSAARLAAKPPEWEPQRIDALYWFFGTAAMFQCGGEGWQKWRAALPALAQQQRQDGNFAGSFDPVGVWDSEGGRVFTTALVALALASAERAARLAETK